MYIVLFYLILYKCKILNIIFLVYNIAYGNAINTMTPFLATSLYWTCQESHSYDVFRYYHYNRFIQSDYTTSPINPLNYDVHISVKITKPLEISGIATKNIHSWHNANYNINPRYSRFFPSKRLEWLDNNIFLPLPADTANLGKWPDYKCSCNRITRDIISKLRYNGTSFKR